MERVTYGAVPFSTAKVAFLLRLSVRFMMVFVLVVGGGLGWFVHHVTAQRDAIKAIMAAGSRGNYDFQHKAWPLNPSGTPPGPKWLVDLLGINFFADVTSLTIGTPQSDNILAYVGRLHRLKRLDAGATRVTDAGLAYLARLSELRSLSCSGSPGLTDAGLAHLDGLERLEAISIEGPTRIIGPGLALLAGLSRLRFLATHTETDAGLPGLSRLIRLRRLFISMTKVTDAAFANLSRLTWLEELALCGERGSDAGLGHLRALADLEILQLHRPWFTDTGLAPVSGMDHLSSFFVSDETSVTDRGLNYLQQRPALRIGVNGTGRDGRARLDLLRHAIGPGSIPTGAR